MNESDEYEVFLETWKPSERLLHSSLPQNIHDPFSKKLMLEDSSGIAAAERARFVPGKKVMSNDELIARSFKFFEDQHDKWASHFREHVVHEGVPAAKLNSFINSFATLWIDGWSDRQNSPEMLAIKASIRDLDRLRYPRAAGRFVTNSVDDGIAPLLTPDEMGVILDANNNLIQILLPDYIDIIGHDGPQSLGNLYVRRGVYMPQIDNVRRERDYLSSFSLALGPVEQFAQTFTPKTEGAGFSSIFSAPISAIQHRVVAFAPFIEGMDLAQLEIVVAPPSEETPLQEDGVYGGIHEFSFK
jgi:hypothetical protein